MDWGGWTDGGGWGFSSDDMGFVPDYGYDADWSMEDGSDGYMGASTDSMGEGGGSGWMSSLGSLFGGSGGSSGMMGGLMSGMGSMFQAKSESKSKKQDLKLQEALAEKLYAAKLAKDEEYYQSHGKQLADAYQGFKKYGDQQVNPTGLLNYANLPQQQPHQAPQYNMPIFGGGGGYGQGQ